MIWPARLRLFVTTINVGAKKNYLACFVQRAGCIMAMQNEEGMSAAAASLLLGGLIVRSLGLAAGISLAILLAAALFTG